MTLSRFAVGAMFLLTSSAFAEPPSVKLLTAPLVAPGTAVGQAWEYYNRFPMTHAPGVGAWTATTRPPEIKELAVALGKNRYSADKFALLVYEYIRNNVAVEFRFGLSKGARGAVIDQSGSAFDQAHLMVELLREGGVAASYQVGTISLSAAQFQAWMGLANPATGLISTAAACQFLADGAIPAIVNGATSCTGLSGTLPTTGAVIVMGHIWVSANSKLYDPSYKIHVVKGGVDLAAALQCGTAGAPTCGTTALTFVPATQTLAGTVPFVQNVNQTGLEAQLKTYATNLQHYIQNANANNYASNNPNMQVEDLIGGTIVDTSQALPTTNPISALPLSAYSAAQLICTTIEVA